MGSRRTLRNNEIKNIITVIRSLENKGILSNRITRKIISREGRLLNFIGPLIKVRLPLMKNVLKLQMQEMQFF